MANWWDEAYSDITKWSVNADQLNKDRGAYKDAFQMNAAEKGLNYELTSKLMDKSTDQEKGMMQLSADLDRRNTLDLMTGEHNFKTAGMQEANRLSKDYLAAEGRETRATIGESGYQDRLKQEVVNRGASDVANIEGGYGLQGVREQQRGETERTGMTLGSQERQIGLTGDESRRTIETQGEQSRRNIETEGEQARRNIRETGGEERRTYSYQRDTDADRATRMSRR